MNSSFLIFDDFMDAMDFPFSVDWKESWDYLIGVEEPTNYEKLTGGLNKIERLNPKKHLSKDFTGFVFLDRDPLKRKNKEDVMGEVRFIRKGNTRYIHRWEEDGVGYKYENFNFINPPFTLTKTYTNLGLDRLVLSSITLRASFEYGYKKKIDFFRTSKNQAIIHIYHPWGSVQELKLRGRDLDNLYLGDFNSYDLFLEKYKNNPKWRVIGERI